LQHFPLILPYALISPEQQQLLENEQQLKIAARRQNTKGLDGARTQGTRKGYSSEILAD
jgi:hypothetical protein